MLGGCYEGSLCDLLLWMLSFSATLGIIAIFSVGVYIVIQKMIGK